MNNPRLKGRTSWLAALPIAVGFVVVKLNVFGAGDFVRSNGTWAAVSRTKWGRQLAANRYP